MPFDLLGFAAHGLMPLPWWGYFVVALALTHVTIACVTIFLHRAQAHRALDLHPRRQPFLPLLAVAHDRHGHQGVGRRSTASTTPRCETPDDPHSPQTRGIKTRLLARHRALSRRGEERARRSSKYGRGTPDDWMERNVYTRYSLGRRRPDAGDRTSCCSAAPALTIWAVQMAWIPVTAAGIINGIGHYWGYRNFASADASTNIVPWGILIGGEELHNNHHAYGTSAKLSSRWYEFDLGWTYIRILETLGLAQVRKVAPTLGSRRRQAGARLRDAAGGDREPLRGRDRLRAHAEGRLRGRARATARARRPQRVRRRAQHARGSSAGCPATRSARCASASARRWPRRWRRAARCRRSTRCARS